VSWALATAGGKDATLALHEARARGLDVRWALNVFEGTSGLVRFHGTPRDVLEDQVRLLGLEPRFEQTHPADFEEALELLLRRLMEEGARGVVFGNLHLADIRSWYEERVQAAGLEHREPLWGRAPREVVEDVIARGFRALVISVNLELADPSWLGRCLDLELLHGFLDAGIDPCGEKGEYHTLVTDGPGFAAPLAVEVAGEREREGHRFLLLSRPTRQSRPPGPYSRGSDS
jgi:diphthine-ammonia ligase